MQTQTTRELPAFELLAEELQRSLRLSDWQIAELRRVFGGFGGQRIDIPRRQWRLHKPDALACARRWLDAGEPVHVIRDRLMSRSRISRSCAYEVIRQARAEGGRDGAA